MNVCTFRILSQFTLRRHLSVFDPKTNKFPYPKLTDSHYLEVKKDRGIVFDSDYPYFDDSKGFRFRSGLVRIALKAFVFPIVRMRLGLRVSGKENLKLHRDTIEKGIVSCSNHVHMWDYISVMKAIRPYKPYILSWAANVNDKDGPLVRLVGGIPIPESNMAATKTYLKAVYDLLKEDHGWLHIYSEGSMWEFYAPIRPFKRGASFLACETDKPVLPLGFSYREPGWIRKHIFKQIATLTLHIGEPVFPNKELPSKEREKDLTIRTHESVCLLAGIDPKENIYPPVFDNTLKVKYY